MGYGAVVMVTDAPPMNEIAAADCAILLKAEYSGQKSIAPRFAVVPSALESAVEKVLAMDERTITAMTSAAQQRVLHFKQEFYAQLNEAVKKL